MRKITVFLLVTLMLLGLTACVTDVAKEDWYTTTIDGTDYSISFGVDTGYTATDSPKSENIVHFYKNGEKVMGGSFLTGILGSAQTDMEQAGSLIEQRKDDNATYSLYKNISEGVSTTHFVIIDFHNKDGFLTFETNQGLENIKPLYENIKVE